LIDLGFLKSAWRYDRKAVVAALREFLDATFPAEGPAEIDAGDQLAALAVPIAARPSVMIAVVVLRIFDMTNLLLIGWMECI
jgi:hypothetical protein